jgi:glycosyltransferase involved in cell wall biosynthesis
VDLEYRIEKIRDTGFTLTGDAEEEIDDTLRFCAAYFGSGRRGEDGPLFFRCYPHIQPRHLIGRCLSSVVAQSFTDWEAIVINNYSEDNTIDVVEGFHDERIHLVNFRNNGIIAASRNEGIRRARGEFVAFLDSDDWWYPPKLERIRGYATDADVLYHDLDIYSVRGRKRFVRNWRRQLARPVFADLMVNWNTYPIRGLW